MTHRIATAFEHPPIPVPPFWRAWDKETARRVPAATHAIWKREIKGEP